MAGTMSKVTGDWPTGDWSRAAEATYGPAMVQSGGGRPSLGRDDAIGSAVDGAGRDRDSTCTCLGVSLGRASARRKPGSNCAADACWTPGGLMLAGLPVD
eukprot:246843-Prymnesium_polylepis.1